MKKILYLSLISFLFASCYIRSFRKKRLSVDSASALLFNSEFCGAKGMSELPECYSRYQKKAGKVPLTHEQIQRFNAVIKNATPYFVLAGILGGPFAFIQPNDSTRGIYLSVYVGPEHYQGGIYDITKRRWYEVKTWEDVLFLYEVGGLSQSTTPAWLETKKYVESRGK